MFTLPQVARGLDMPRSTLSRWASTGILKEKFGDVLYQDKVSKHYYLDSNGIEKLLPANRLERC